MSSQNKALNSVAKGYGNAVMYVCLGILLLSQFNTHILSPFLVYVGAAGFFIWASVTVRITTENLLEFIKTDYEDT